MPVVKQTLPDGSVKVLTGGAAEAYLAAQKKAEKEAKKALEKKKVAAIKAGDADAAWAAKAELSSSNAAARMSASEDAQAEVLNEIRAGSSAYQFYRVLPTDWKSDAEEVRCYLYINLGFQALEWGKVSKEAPGKNDIHLFTGMMEISDEKIKEIYEKSDKFTQGQFTLEKFTDSFKQPKIFELHPSLLKKNGKIAVDIPEGALVAVKSVKNTAQRIMPHRDIGLLILKQKEININHSYICAVIPPEMEASCIV